MGWLDCPKPRRSELIAATHTPGAYEDVVRLVLPELQRRGVFRDRYTGSTLRDTLGLERPASHG